MKLFISWSGVLSEKIAEAFKELLYGVSPRNVQAFLSSSDVKSGEEWFRRIRRELVRASGVVVCLTPQNLRAPWIFLEAGAIGHKLPQSRVFVLLGGVLLRDVPKPLDAFQVTPLDRSKMLRLIKDILAAKSTAALKDAQIVSLFNEHWPAFEKATSEALAVHGKEPGPTVDGIVRFFSTRAELKNQEGSSNWWETGFFSPSRHPKRVLLMSQLMRPTFKNERICRTIVKWCRDDHCEMRLIFLSPSRPELPQSLCVGKGIKTLERPSCVVDPGQMLPYWINDTIENLRERVLSQIPDDQRKPSIRFAHCNLPYCMNVIDDEMYVSFYGTQPEGDDQPTIRIARGGNESPSPAFHAFEEEFQRIWNEHSSVYQYEDLVISEYRSRARGFIPFWQSGGEPAPPTEAIVFPTYVCSAVCPFCMFKQFRKETAPISMSRADFRDALDQVYRLGVRRVEISGGGEPLEHPQVKALLQVLRRMRSRKEGRDGQGAMKFGLLTNGLQLGAFPPDELLTIFNDYLRVSLCSRVYEDLLSGATPGGQYHGWRDNIEKLILTKEESLDNHYATKIGIKILLVPEQVDTFVSVVRRLLEDDRLREGIDHWRFRSSRAVKPADVIPPVEQRVYHMLSKYFNTEEMESKISLRMSHTQYPIHRQCWLSAMNVVLAPNLDVYQCYNYVWNSHDKRLGNLRKAPLDRIWRSTKHREVLARWMDCRRNPYADCRIAELQERMESSAIFLR